MLSSPFAKNFYIAIVFLGFGFLGFRWITGGNLGGFFLLLFMICMTILRWRSTKFKWTVAAELIFCVAVYPWAFPIVGALAVGNVFYWLWEQERERGLARRDAEAGKVYELESAQRDLHAATARIERMTAISERARIAREIHDNAGHEIVAAYISLQAVRAGFDDASGVNEDALRLYDAALLRLDSGVNKIREAVHNLAPVSAIGAEALREICEKFHGAVEFKLFGNTAQVPVHVWNVLEACLNETLTNAAKHAPGERVSVNIDATPHIARLCVENTCRADGVPLAHDGQGLRNLRYRAAAVGGNFSVSGGEKFCAICVIPLKSTSGREQEV